MNACSTFRRLPPAMQWYVIVLSACAGCSKSNERLEVIVSGDTAGWITPCGCASNQSGGLSRRATLIAGLGTPDEVLYLDAGGSASGASEYQRIKLEAILRGLQSMKLVAHNIGAPETELEPAQLARLADATGVTWLSANLQPVNGGFMPKRCLVLQRNGMRIGITGVADPALVKNNTWRAREPVAAVLESFSDAKVDVRIVLAYFEESGLRSLAQSLPEVDFLIGGPTGQAMKPAMVGPVSVLSATNKGKFLARIQLAGASGKRFETKSIGPAEVTSDLAENAALVDNLKRYYSTLAKRDFTVREAGLASAVQGDSAYRIAGSESCGKCHADDSHAWHSSRHSHAWEVLVAKQAQFDPFCQQCHTTGYGHDGGFVSVSKSPQLVHVGCENCHGPSAAHVANPKTKTPFLAAERCTKCHDHENSPQFAFDKYWEKIRHGSKGLKADKPLDTNRQSARTEVMNR